MDSQRIDEDIVKCLTIYFDYVNDIFQPNLKGKRRSLKMIRHFTKSSSSSFLSQNYFQREF